MKKIFFILFIYTSVLFVFSCKTKTHDDHSGEHTHADGTVHKDGDHNHDETVVHDQESFEVDTAEVHDHDHDHDHDKNHDKNHEH